MTHNKQNVHCRCHAMGSSRGVVRGSATHHESALGHRRCGRCGAPLTISSITGGMGTFFTGTRPGLTVTMPLGITRIIGRRAWRGWLLHRQFDSTICQRCFQRRRRRRHHDIIEHNFQIGHAGTRRLKCCNVTFGQDGAGTTPKPPLLAPRCLAHD